MSSSIIKRVGISSASVFIAKVINLGVATSFNVFVARHLGDSKYGVFSYAIVLVSFIGIIVDFGIHSIVARDIIRYDSEKGDLLGNAFIVKLLLVLLSAAVLALVSFFSDYSSEQQYVIAVVFLITIFSARISGVRRLLEMPFQAACRLDIPAKLQVVDSLVLILLTIVALKLRLDLLGVAVIFVLSSVPGFMVQVKQSFGLIPPTFRLKKKVVFGLLKESLPMGIYSFGVIICHNFDLFLMKHLFSDADLGHYAAAVRLIMPFSFIPYALVSAVFPLMTHYSKDGEKSEFIWKMGVKFFLLSGAILTIIFFALAKPLVVLLYGAPFEPAVWPLRIQVLSFSCMFINFFIVDFNTAHGRQRTNQVVITIALVVNILLNLLLTPQNGLIGASLARLVTTMVISFSLLKYSKLMDKKLFEIILGLGTFLTLFAIFYSLAMWIPLFLFLLFSLAFFGFRYARIFFSHSEMALLKGAARELFKSSGH